MFTFASIIDNALKVVNAILSAFQRKQDRDAGAAAQREATDAATLKTLEAVSAPVDNAACDELWDRNKARYGTDRK